MADVLQVILLLMILFWLIGLKRSHDAALATSPGVGLDELRGEMRELRGSLDAIRDHLGEMQKDHEILDELEENVMEEWARVIEDKLGKRPVVVPCPSCGWKGGLEPNLLADVVKANQRQTEAERRSSEGLVSSMPDLPVARTAELGRLVPGLAEETASALSSIIGRADGLLDVGDRDA